MPNEILDQEKQLGSAEVLKHLDLLQAVITRMASNSSACKGWAIALVAAVLAFLASDNSALINGAIATIPLFLFFLLDAYYLSLEEHFRTAYNAFVGRLHGGSAKKSELFVLTPPDQKKMTSMVFAAIKSISVWPFYALLAAMISGISWLVLGAGT